MKKMIQPIRPEELAGLSAMLFGGATLLAATLAVWNLTASLRLTEAFAVSDGVLSSWIVWAALAVAFRFVGKHIEREMLMHAEQQAIFVRPARPSPPNDGTAAAA